LTGFRFRGKTRSLIAICAAFRAHPDRGLHPAQIARFTGLPINQVHDRLNRTPELFVRLPPREGITRYRLATSLAILSPEALETRILKAARAETLTLYAIVAIVIAIITLGVVMTFPFMSFQ